MNLTIFYNKVCAVKKFLLIFLFFAFIFNSCSSIIWTDFPENSGKLGIGRRAYSWIDSTRSEQWIDNSSKKRKLVAYVWYPADVNKNSPNDEYFPLMNKLEDEFSFFEKVAIHAMKTNAVLNAPLSNAYSKYPVILLSPGAGVSTFFYTSIIENLVSNGYIVAAVEHTYEGRGQVFPDGSITHTEAEKKRPDKNSNNFEEIDAKFFRKRVEIRTKDISFILKRLSDLNTNDVIFTDKIDLSNAGVLGHSIGGVTSAQVLVYNTNLKAGINMDGLTYARPVIPDSNGKVISQPFLFITKPFHNLTENELKRSNITRKEDDAILDRLTAKQDSILSLVKNDCYRILIKNAKHQSFSDEPFFEPDGGKEKQRLAVMINDFVLSFFNYYLKNKTESPLEKVSLKYKDVNIKKY